MNSAKVGGDEWVDGGEEVTTRLFAVLRIQFQKYHVIYNLKMLAIESEKDPRDLQSQSSKLTSTPNPAFANNPSSPVPVV